VYVKLFDRVANSENINEEFLDEIMSWSSDFPDKVKVKKN
jgi:hypothetical protein